jgi:hypothetical protein
MEQTERAGAGELPDGRDAPDAQHADVANAADARHAGAAGSADAGDKGSAGVGGVADAGDAGSADAGSAGVGGVADAGDAGSADVGRTADAGDATDAGHPSQPGSRRHVTGEPRVDAALARLDELAGQPITEHRAIFDDVHARLREVLGELDTREQRSGDEAGAERRAGR